MSSKYSKGAGKGGRYYKEHLGKKIKKRMKKKNNKKSSKGSGGKGSRGSSSSSKGSSGGGKGKGGSKGGGSSVNGGGSPSTGSGKSPRSKSDTSGSRSDDDSKKSKTKSKAKSKSSSGSDNKVRVHRIIHFMSDIVWRFSIVFASHAYYFFSSDIYRKNLRTTRLKTRTPPGMTRANLRPAPITGKRVPIRTVKSLIPAKEDPSRAAMAITDPVLAKEERVVGPSLMAMVLLRQAKVDPSESPRPELTARAVLESSK